MSPVSLQFLLSFAVKGVILLAATTVAAALSRHTRASVRHAIWAAGLTGLLLVPALSLGLPRWEVVPLPAPPAEVAVVLTAIPGTASREASRPIESIGTPKASAPVPAAEASRREAPAPVAPAAPFDLARAILLTWSLGTGLLLAWLLFGHLRVRRIVLSASPMLSPEWQETIEKALSLSPVGFRVNFRETAASMPMAAGILHPVVLLPGAGTGWTAGHRRDVVVHELAHVRRRDCLIHLASRVACAIHWFNPLAWVALRQERMEREHACDDAVLAAGALPSSYAQALLETARSSPPAWATASAGLTMARPSHLANRLLAVLDQGRRRGQLGKAALGAASFGMLALLAPVAAMAPARPHAGHRPRPSGLPSTLRLRSSSPRPRHRTSTAASRASSAPLSVSRFPVSTARAAAPIRKADRTEPFT